jgi:uncharacterized protein (TIRG00374 family)
MSFRTWVSIITVILLALVVFFGRHEIIHAWHLIGRVNILILLLMLPVQIFSYFAIGSMIFSYLRSKGDLKTTSRLSMARMSLELNFVNHIIPSGGAAGFTYLGWVLGRHGVSAGRAAMAQIVRFSLTFISFILLLILAVFILTLDGRVNRAMITVSLVLVFTTTVAAIAAVYVIGNKRHITKFSNWIVKTVNRIVRKFTRGKKPALLKTEKIESFFLELHEDFLEIKRDKRILITPSIWAILANIADVILFVIAFGSLGVWVDPAILFVAFGVAGLASAVSITPGGAGIYEAVMIAFLVTSGVPPAEAIAGTILARVILLLGTILFGYVFYQMSIIRYGKVQLGKKV